MSKTYKIKDFNVVDDDMVMDIKRGDENTVKGGFFISYFNDTYREKFSLKRACLDMNDKIIGYLFYSENGNKVRVNLC